MEISKLTGPRFELAIGRLGAGDSVVFEGIGLRLSDEILECRIPSSFRAENATDDTIRRDLEAARAKIAELLQESPALMSLVGARRRRFVVLDDYGGGGVELMTVQE
ncbi:MAG TPA: hypothetical protein VLD59_10730 [Steroidobacteraceae bacterium]|nr:hypothetical protein [Steroidobacteraceae bacterium]